MKAKSPLLIGAGLAVALTCGLAPLPAIAAVSDTSADRLGASLQDSTQDMSQIVTPKLSAGGTAKAKVRLPNLTGSYKVKGVDFVITAPSGTSFASPNIAIRYNTGWSNIWKGTLSADKRTLTMYSEAQIPVKGWVDMEYSLLSDAGNSRRGIVSDGSVKTVGGFAAPVGLVTPLAYEAIEATIVSQAFAPELQPGESGPVTMQIRNNTGAVTQTGATFVATAPAGTTFASANASAALSGGYRTTWTGTLSADKRTLTFVRTGFKLAAAEGLQLQLTISSNADNTLTGSVADGELRITAGPAIAPGELHSISYTSLYEAPAIAPVELTAPAIGAVVTDTKRPVFSGTAHPGATVTVTGSSGRVVATTTAKADGSWSVPSSFDLGNGSYFGTVSQSADGSTVRYEFSVNVAPEPKEVVTPVTLTAPELGSKLQAGNPVFSGKGQPGATVVVRGAFGTTLGSAKVTAQGTWSVRSSIWLDAGSYTGTAAQTVNGTTTTAGFRFSIEKPEVQVTPVTLASPVIGAELAPGNPVFSGTGHPGGTITVLGQFGTVLGTGTVTSQGTWSVRSAVSLVAGSYAGTVRQEMNGKVSTASFSFSAAQSVALTAPAKGATVATGKVMFTGTGKPGATVTVRGQWGTPLGSGTVKANGTWSIESTVSLVAGSYAGTVTQDADGRITTAAFSFTAK